MAEWWESAPVATAPEAEPNWYDKIPEAGGEQPSQLSEGFFKRAYAGLNHIPRDIVDNFMEGVHSTIAAPGQILGTGTRRPVGMDNLGPEIEEQLKASGFEPGAASRESARVLRTLQRQKGQTGLVFGPLQAIASPLLGPIRSLISRPLEESQGIPKEISEPLMMAAAGAALGLRSQMTRVKIAGDGVKAEPIGEPPTQLDFKAAASKIIEGEFTVVDEKGLPSPQKMLPAPKPEVVEENLRTMWEEDGDHPAEVARDVEYDPFLRQQVATMGGPPLAEPQPFVKPAAIQPIRGSLVPSSTPRHELARTGNPYIDSLLSDPVLQKVINNPVVDDTHTVPNSLGGSTPIHNPTIYRDHEFPKTMTVDGVKFDTAEPAAIHENVEEFAIDVLTKAGMDQATALKVAFWNFGEVAEDAWYRSHGIDPAKIDEMYQEHLDRIASRGVEPEPVQWTSKMEAQYKDWRRGGAAGPEDNRTLWADQFEARLKRDIGGVPSDLFRGTYPDGDPAKASPGPIGKPTPAQLARALVMMSNAGYGPPPRSANLAPNAMPRTMYPQQPTAGGHPPPPGGPPQGPPQVGPPPPQGPGPPFINPVPTPYPQARAPFFTYDDRSAFAKAFSNVIRTWQETFQPELVSDKALQADPYFAQYKAASQNLKDQIVRNAEDSYQFWRKQPEADRIDYLRSVESGTVPTQWQARADIHRQILQKAHQLEVQAGSRADYFENYFPHIWESPQQARNWVEGQTAQLGPTWFQKERTFKAIQDGLDAGLRLKTSNPEALITHRLFSTADMLERMDLLGHMKDLGVAIPVAEARAQRAQRIQIAQQLGFPIDVTTIGRDLSAEGWETINAPGGTGRGMATAGRVSDDRQWFIAPDIRPLWENAIRAPGLWGDEGNLGSAFRGWMALKAVWIPIKLALSAFHPLHVMHINMTGHIVQAVRDASRGEYGDAMKSLGDVLYDPIAAAVPGLTHEGKFAREAWHVPEDARTPLEHAIVKTMEEGGVVANISEQLKIDSQRKLEEAWDKNQWFRMAPRLVQEAVRRVSAPVFEHWIPNLKVSAYLREAADFLSQHPQIANDDVQRGVALRTIGKSVENRYGEMFYGGLFWNRTTKDIGIGSFLSLGWNAGFVREFGGAATGPLARGVRGITRGPTPTEETIYQAQSKGAYATAYVAGAMLINGIITYATTGEDPDGMDWALPRIGRNNPDGSPHRLTNMFYTRELPMVAKHIQDAGGLVGGVADTLYSKLVVAPFVELARNRDYYGNEIWSEGNPLYKRAQQVMQYVFGNQFNPMSVSGAQQAMKTGGGWDEAALAVLGFGPAPNYANKTATQNLVEHLFKKFVVPESRPQEMGAQSKDRGDIRSQILLAQQRGDDAAVQAETQKWFKAGGSRQGLTNILQHIPPDVSMFRALPESAQQQVMAQSPPEETGKYRPYLKSDTAAHVADLQVEAMQAAGMGDTAGAERLAGEIKATLSEAVASGKITNLGEFQRSVQQGMMFRLNPQAAAQKADVGRQRKLLMMPAQP